MFQEEFRHESRVRKSATRIKRQLRSLGKDALRQPLGLRQQVLQDEHRRLLLVPHIQQEFRNGFWTRDVGAEDYIHAPHRRLNPLHP